MTSNGGYDASLDKNNSTLEKSIAQSQQSKISDMFAPAKGI